MKIAGLAALLLAACGGASPSVPPNDEVVQIGYPPIQTTSAEAAPEPPHEGPLRVTGYPGFVASDFDAVAVHGGFTSNGDELGVCWDDGGSEDLHCLFADRAGNERVFQAPLTGNLDSKDHVDPRGHVGVWLKANGLASFKVTGKSAWEVGAPPLTGEWRYGNDIEIEVRETPPIIVNGAQTVAPKVEIGGRVHGHAAVFPFTFNPPVGSSGLTAHFVRLVVFALSPDGSEFGVITHSPGMEFDSNYEITRIPVETFARRILEADCALRPSDPSCAH